MTPATVVLPELDPRTVDMLKAFERSVAEQLRQVEKEWRDGGPHTPMRLGIMKAADEWALRVIGELLKSRLHGLRMLAAAIRVHGTDDALIHQHAMALRIVHQLAPYFEANPIAAVHFLQEL